MILTFFAAALAAVVSGCDEGANRTSDRDENIGVAFGAATTYHVDITGFAYDPGDITIQSGDTITWHNHDTAPHTVTVSDGPVMFDSGTLQQDDTFSYTFHSGGLYEYYCAVHPSMTASVTVQGSHGGSDAGTDADCIPATEVALIWAHVQAAHLQPSLVQQIQMLLDTDAYVQAHTVWVSSLLQPIVTTGPAIGADTLALILAHVETAHLNTSVLQQLADLLNVNSYVLFHTAWLNQVLKPTLDQLTCS